MTVVERGIPPRVSKPLGGGTKPRERLRHTAPKLIVWSLTPVGVGAACDTGPLLSPHECMLIVDSVARYAKPIMVLTGTNLTLHRPDLPDIVGYGSALGLKMVIEIQPEECTDELLKMFRPFGPKVFRLILDDRVVEDMHTRYRPSVEFSRLEEAVGRLTTAGFEPHFSLTVTIPDARQLNFNIDYACRRGARGLYFHLRLARPASSGKSAAWVKATEEFIGKISELKPMLPEDMLVSPQCLRYNFTQPDEFGTLGSKAESSQPHHWVPACLAGKTYSFIDHIGRIRVCGVIYSICGDLRSNGYDFEQVWVKSPVLCYLRKDCRTCSETQSAFGYVKMRQGVRNTEDKIPEGITHEENEGNVATFS